MSVREAVSARSKGAFVSEQTIEQAKLILVVDDEKAVVQALAKRCEQLGIKVYKAQDAIEAMAMINHHDATLDLMLLDYHMPGADGLTLCDMVKTSEAHSSIPVILLTGHDNEETRRRCQAAGAHFVRKDVDAWEKLEPLIRRLLGLGNAPGPRVPAAKSRSQEESAAQQPTTAAKNVLIIDDDPMIAKGLRIRLEALGYRAHGALNGMDVDVFGERILDAVINEEFYIVTDANERDMVAARHARIMEAFDRVN